MTNPPGDGETPRDPNPTQPLSTPPTPPPGWGQPGPSYPGPAYGGPAYPAAGQVPPYAGPQGQPYPYQPWPGQVPPGWYAGPSPWQPPDHPRATLALVLGVVSLLGGFACYLPILAGPWAWAVGRRVVKEIDAQPGRYSGRGQALAGYVLGVVATVLLVLAVLGVLVVLALFVSVGTSTPGPVVNGESL